MPIQLNSPLPSPMSGSNSGTIPVPNSDSTSSSPSSFEGASDIDPHTDALLQAVGAKNQAIRDSSDTIKSLMQQSNNATDDEINAQKAAGYDSMVVSQTGQAALQQAQQRSLDTAAALGADPSSSSYILNELASKLRQATIDAANKTDEVQKNLSTSFLDNPGKWVANQFTQGDQIQEADMANAKVAQLRNSMKAINDSADEATVRNNALAVVSNAATLAASLDSIAQGTRISADQIRQKAATTNINSVLALKDMSQTELFNLVTANAASNDAARLDLAKQAMVNSEAQAKQESDLTMQKIKMGTITLQGMEGDQAVYNSIGATISKGAALMGFPDISAQDAKMNFRMLSINPQLYKPMYDIGLANSKLPPGTSAISQDLATTIKLVTQTNAPLGLGDTATRQAFQQAWAKASQGGNIAGVVGPDGIARNQTIDPSSIDSIAQGAATFVRQKAVTDIGNVMLGGADNLYAPLPMQSLATAATKLPEDTFWKNILAPQIASGMKDFNATRVLDLGAAAINDPNSSVKLNDVIAGIQKIANVNITSNNSVKGYFGKGLPKQDSFNVQIPNSFGFLQKYNLATPAGATAAILSRLNTSKGIYNNQEPLGNPMGD